MDKVFVNDDIFQSDGDYVIGGFVAPKESNYNLADFTSQFSDKSFSYLLLFDHLYPICLN